MSGRDRIRHPGPPSAERVSSARGTARRLTVTLPGGAILMQAVADAMDAAGCDSAVMVLDGLRMGDYRYVMPGPSHDGAHAAWYSAKHEGENARLHHATAIVGRRNGAWWLHCHAVWDVENRARSGHLLPDEVRIVEDAPVTLHAFEGGAFEVRHDDETNFDIFHATGGAETGNAVIAKLAPHEDTATAIAALARDVGFDRAEVVGIGSLIGAVFEEDALSMASPISEVLFTPGARLEDGNLHLPTYCVDPDDGQFFGNLRKGGGPVCVTFELMIFQAGNPGS